MKDTWNIIWYIATSSGKCLKEFDNLVLGIQLEYLLPYQIN